MGSHPMHQQLSDPGTFSQHQPMERDDSGIVAPSNIFHQPMPNSFVDFSKVSYRELDLWNDPGLTLLHLLFCLFTLCVPLLPLLITPVLKFFYPRTDQKRGPSPEAGLNKARVCRLQIFSGQQLKAFITLQCFVSQKLSLLEKFHKACSALEADYKFA